MMTGTQRIIIAVLVVGIIAAALAGVGIHLFENRVAVAAYTPPPAEPPGKGVVGNAKLDTDPYDVVIDYTDGGFQPESTTVKQGTRVRFLNDSGTTFWPAVGVHPTHTLYPEKEPTDCLGSSFDACQDLQPGEFFDFTLYYVGTWPIHDHLHAYNTGSVTVTSK